MLISPFVSVRIFVMDAQLSSLNFEQTTEKGAEEINEVPRNTTTPLGKEAETPPNTGTENSVLPPLPENVKDERKEVTPDHTLVAGDSITSLADRMEKVANDEFQKNNLPNGSA